MPGDFLVAFGRRLARNRVAAGLTQVEVAARWGKARGSVANIEGGRQPVALHEVPSLAKAVGCRVRDLLPPRWFQETKP